MVSQADRLFIDDTDVWLTYSAFLADGSLKSVVQWAGMKEPFKNEWHTCIEYDFDNLCLDARNVSLSLWFVGNDSYTNSIEFRTMLQRTAQHTWTFSSINREYTLRLVSWTIDNVIDDLIKVSMTLSEDKPKRKSLIVDENSVSTPITTDISPLLSDWVDNDGNLQIVPISDSPEIGITHAIQLRPLGEVTYELPTTAHRKKLILSGWYKGGQYDTLMENGTIVSDAIGIVTHGFFEPNGQTYGKRIFDFTYSKDNWIYFEITLYWNGEDSCSIDIMAKSDSQDHPFLLCGIKITATDNQIVTHENLITADMLSGLNSYNVSDPPVNGVTKAYDASIVSLQLPFGVHTYTVSGYTKGSAFVQFPQGEGEDIDRIEEGSETWEYFAFTKTITIYKDINIQFANVCALKVEEGSIATEWNDGLGGSTGFTFEVGSVKHDVAYWNAMPYKGLLPQIYNQQTIISNLEIKSKYSDGIKYDNSQLYNGNGSMTVKLYLKAITLQLLINNLDNFFNFIASGKVVIYYVNSDNLEISIQGLYKSMQVNFLDINNPAAQIDINFITISRSVL